MCRLVATVAVALLLVAPVAGARAAGNQPVDPAAAIYQEQVPTTASAGGGGAAAVARTRGSSSSLPVVWIVVAAVAGVGVLAAVGARSRRRGAVD